VAAVCDYKKKIRPERDFFSSFLIPRSYDRHYYCARGHQFPLFFVRFPMSVVQSFLSFRIVSRTKKRNQHSSRRHISITVTRRKNKSDFFSSRTHTHTHTHVYRRTYTLSTTHLVTIYVYVNASLLF